MSYLGVALTFASLSGKRYMMTLSSRDSSTCAQHLLYLFLEIKCDLRVCVSNVITRVDSSDMS